MDSPSKHKASLKHLDFHLQREKALTKELEEKCKQFQAQIAQLEQDKAELRREKLLLVDDAKKAAKLEERIHVLLKECESKDATIASERANTLQARAEAEEVRRSAKASIASWTAAEEQWIAEQASLNEAVLAFQEQLHKAEEKTRERAHHIDELQRQLAMERERGDKLAAARDTLEADVSRMHVQIEELQNKTFECEQTIYKLDRAGDMQKEALDLKETEIKTLEARLGKQAEVEEKMEQTINTLNDRINAAKMVNLESKSENEKLLCDVADAHKEVQRLTMIIDSLKREQGFSQQSQASLQKTLDETREKCRTQQEELKEKCVEIRRHELTISQLNVEKQKLENTLSEQCFHQSTADGELNHVKEQLKSAQSALAEAATERAQLKSEIAALQQQVDGKAEDMVLLQSQMEDRVENLQKDIRSLENEAKDRQRLLDDATLQLATMNEKNAAFHSRILVESEMTSKARQEMTHLLDQFLQQQRAAFISQALQEKVRLETDFMTELCREVHGSMKDVVERYGAAQTSFGEHLGSLEQRVSQQKGELAASHEELQVHQRRIGALVEEVGRREEREDALNRSLQKLQQELSSMSERAVASATHLAEQEAIRATLEDQLAKASAKLAEKEQNASAIELAKKQDAQRMICFFGAATEHLRANAELLLSSELEKVAVLVQFLRQRITASEARFTALLAAKEGLEVKCRELSAFAKEAKASMNRSDLSGAERYDALLAKANTTERQLAAALKEKEQLSFQLSVLLDRFEAQQKGVRSAQDELEGALRAEVERREAAERAVQKLRAGLDYELKRKCDYKAALDEAKRLREESEKCRLREKELAADAIKKANGEAGYWVICFDKLKRLTEAHRRDGTRIPSIEPDTAKRLEAAMSIYEPALHQQDVNTSEQNQRQKRARVESGGSATH